MNASREQIAEWFQDEAKTIRNYAEETLHPEDDDVDAAVDRAVEHIAKTLSRCRSTSRDNFVRWAARQITHEPSFRGSEGGARALDLDVLGLLNRAEQVFDFKPFIAEQHGKTLFIDMGEHEGEQKLWKVPTDRMAVIQRQEYPWSDDVENLWPCFLRKIGNV